MLLCTSRDFPEWVLDLHCVAETGCHLSQLRYDLGKLRIDGVVERKGWPRRYRLIAKATRASPRSPRRSISLVRRDDHSPGLPLASSPSLVEIPSSWHHAGSGS